MYLNVFITQYTFSLTNKSSETKKLDLSPIHLSMNNVKNKEYRESFRLFRHQYQSFAQAQNDYLHILMAR